MVARVKENLEAALDQFCRYVRKHRKRPVYVGIDPGSTGALGFVCGEASTAIDIPTFKVSRGKGNKTAFNYPEIVELFYEFRKFRSRVHVCLEVPPPSMGPGKGSAYGQFRLGIAYGIWPLFLIQKGFKVEEVSPHVWKKKMKVGRNKDDARMKALGMFPKAQLRLKKHHNRAEALLLAEYLRRTRRGR